MSPRKTTLNLLPLLAILASEACGGGKQGTPSAPSTSSFSQSVLVGGTCNVGSNQVIDGYWKNGSWQTFSDPYGHGYLVSGYSVGIDASGNVYVGGIGYGSSDVPAPGYWKNGTWNPVKVWNATYGGGIDSITCDAQGNVYAYGPCWTSSTGGEVVYWINGAFQSVEIPSSLGGGFTEGGIVADSAGNVFIAGETYLGTDTLLETAGYWKNGTWTALAHPYGEAQSCSARGLAVVGQGGVVVAGECTNGSDQVQGFWRNGAWKEINNPSTSSVQATINSIAADASGNSYIAGFLSSNASGSIQTPGYWMNGIWNPLATPSGTTSCSVDSIAVDPSGTIYVGGACSNGIYYTPGYWRNGTWISNSNPYGAPYGAGIQAIAVNASGDMGSAGWCFDGYQEAGYWRENAWHPLANPYGSDFDAAVNSVAMDASGSLYAAGWCSEGSNRYRYGYTLNDNPGYWKDGIWNALTGQKKGAHVAAIAFDPEGNLIAAGGEDGFTYGYWKNGIWAGLSLPTEDWAPTIRSIAFDPSGNSYIAADCNNNNENMRVVGYWKNEAWNQLPTPPSAGYFYDDVLGAIAFDALGNLYATGNFIGSNTMACGYWKNGAWNGLSNPYGSSEFYVTSISVDTGGTVYAAGYSCNAAGVTVPGYWKNGTWQPLNNPKGASFDAVVHSIKVDSKANVYAIGYCSDQSGLRISGCWENGAWSDFPNPHGAYDTWSASLVLTAK